jgi:hypothetical protein
MVNNREVVIASPRVTVSELKEHALVPANDKLYDKTGRVLRDEEVVSTDDAEYGAVTDWTRGAVPGGDRGEVCPACGEPIHDDEEVTYLVTCKPDSFGVLVPDAATERPAHAECVPPDDE